MPKHVEVGSGAQEVVVTAQVTDATGAEAPGMFLDSPR
jgi:hypothetical protein